MWTFSSGGVCSQSQVRGSEKTRDLGVQWRQQAKQVLLSGAGGSVSEALARAARRLSSLHLTEGTHKLVQEPREWDLRHPSDTDVQLKTKLDGRWPGVPQQERSPKDWCYRPPTATSHHRNEAESCRSPSLHHNAEVSWKSLQKDLLSHLSTAAMRWRESLPWSDPQQGPWSLGVRGRLTYTGVCDQVSTCGPAPLPSLSLLKCLELRVRVEVGMEEARTPMEAETWRAEGCTPVCRNMVPSGRDGGAVCPGADNRAVRCL